MRRRRHGVDRDAARGRDHRARQGLRRAARLRRDAGGHDVRRRLRGRRGPPVPHGHPAPHRPRAAVVVRGRLGLATARWTARSGRWRPTPRPTCSARSTTRPSSTAQGGQEVVDDATAYVQGINAYIDAAKLDPSKLPAEYAAFGKSPDPWTLNDIVATASLIGGIFGKGGGRELDSAQILQALTKRFGTRKGRLAWKDFRQKRDPETITTIRGKRFPYETGDPFAKTRPRAARPRLGQARADRARRSPAPAPARRAAASGPT